MRLGVFAIVAASAAASASGQVTLEAHPGPATLFGSSGTALFFDLEARRGPVIVSQLRTANTAFANQPFAFELLVRDGTGLGGSSTSGPGSSMAGWTSLGIVHGVQGPQTEGISLPVDIPDFSVTPGTIRGVAFRFTEWGHGAVRGSEPVVVYQDDGLRLMTGDVRSQPFTPNGTLVRNRLLVGSITYVAGDPCYANCDGSTTAPLLNVLDFVCFIQRFAAADLYANCDGSTEPSPLNVNDFICFQQRFAAGCQ